VVPKSTKDGVPMGHRAACLALIALSVVALTGVAEAQVLRVGAYHGIPGQFTSIQSAVNRAAPGDTILVAPGDYKTTAVHFPKGNSTFPAAVLITTGKLTLRGMNRSGVVVDGTKAGSPRCSNVTSDQSYGASASGSASSSYAPARASDAASGVTGVMVYKAPNVAVENLTTCNFLSGADDAGNGVWFNGGDGSGAIGGYGYTGSYLTTTSTFYGDESTAAAYGVFSSNWSGGTWDQIYASNFNDSGFYIGACQQVCNQTMNHAWSQYNALGYSGTNSGGRLVVENSQFDNNEDGFDTNSQNADEPSPQNGACPNGAISPITHTNSCWVFIDNYVHDNNNPNVPAAGSAAAGPVGTGMSISGGRNDTIMDNRFENNGAWGVIVVPYPDSGPPCTGGTETSAACVFDESGVAVIGNQFKNNGSFGNPTNGDIAAVNLEPGPTDCYSANTEEGGGSASTSPSNLQQTYPSCNGATVPPNGNLLFLQQAACDSQSIQLAALAGGSFCLPGTNYPRHATGQPMPPVPSGLPTMPHPCSGVTADPWCSGQVIRVAGCSARSVSLRLSLAVRERFVSVAVKAGGRKAVRDKARGAHRTVRVGLGAARHRRVRVGLTEQIMVARHRETIKFTRIYHRC
jgi:hypothetical protein